MLKAPTAYSIAATKVYLFRKKPIWQKIKIQVKIIKLESRRK